MREIVLDTETTGIEPAEGHRLVEIGCLELFNHVPTGKHWHTYLNPERDVPADAVSVHGLTTEFLQDKPVFSEVFADFIDFIGEAGLVIHNAEFDMKFINAELRTVGHKGIPANRVTDTLLMARRKFPGSPASLDALCRRFGIDNSARDLHGALLDSELLADVYLELLGGRQHGLELDNRKTALRDENPSISKYAPGERKFRQARPHAPTDEEINTHMRMLEDLPGSLWKNASGQ